MTTEAQPETETLKSEVAFVESAAGYELFGQKLEPFSAVRQAAASAMGLRFGLVDESDIFKVTVETLKEGKQDIQFYNQLFSDVITVIWLCSMGVGRVLRALRKVDEAKADAYLWADENKISLVSENYYRAAGIFFSIMKAIAESTGAPDLEQSNEEDDQNPNA